MEYRASPATNAARSDLRSLRWRTDSTVMITLFIAPFTATFCGPNFGF